MATTFKNGASLHQLPEVAGAQDLCFEVLRVVDGREGTGLASSYLRGLG